MKISDLITETYRLNEAPLPNDWDASEFNTNYPNTPEDPKVSTFSSRLRYALERSTKLGTGSARVAVTIEYEGRQTVLKVAKNAKGMAQNQAEVDILEDGYVSQLDIVIPLIDYDKSNKTPVWIQTELAQKVSEKQLCDIMKCPSLYSLFICTEYQIGERKNYMGKNPITLWTSPPYSTDPNDNETFMEYINELSTLVDASGLSVGDFGRVANWGLYQGRPVVIDLGLTTIVHDIHYKRPIK